MAKRDRKAEKEQKKREKELQKIPDPLYDGVPYDVSSSFTWHNGKCMALFELNARIGTNRHLSFSDIIGLIPTSPLRGVDVWFIVDDALIKDDDKKRLIRKNAFSNKNAISNLSKDGSKKEQSDSSANHAKRCEFEDYDDYSFIVDAAEPIVLFTIRLLIQADTSELVEEQIHLINLNFNKRHDGLRFNAVAGDQLTKLERIFKPLPKNLSVMTSTGSNYSGFNFGIRPQLADLHGIPMGTDVLSVTQASAFIDFESCTKEIGIIALPSSAVMRRYANNDDNESLRRSSASSMVAQAAANNICVHDHRVSHLVLNDFDYFEPGRYFAPAETRNIMCSYDVSRKTVNPLQGFGDVNDAVFIYNQLVRKIVNIFDVLENYTLTKDDRAIILNSAQNFYMHSRLWSPDAILNPVRVKRLVDADDPTTFPTLAQFINEFTTLANAAVNNNRELKADKIDALYAILSEVLSSNMMMFGRPTSIDKNDDSPQVYYNFANVPTTQLQQAQFINLLPFVIGTCKKGDLIVVHGANRLWLETLIRLSETIDHAQKSGIRFVFALDSIGERPHSVKGQNYVSLFNMQHVLYTDLDSDIDWSLIGKMSVDELNMYEKALGLRLSDIIRVNALAKTNCRALFHRCADYANNFIDLNVLI